MWSLKRSSWITFNYNFGNIHKLHHASRGWGSVSDFVPHKSLGKTVKVWQKKEGKQKTSKLAWRHFLMIPLGIFAPLENPKNSPSLENIWWTPMTYLTVNWLRFSPEVLQHQQGTLLLRDPSSPSLTNRAKLSTSCLASHLKNILFLIVNMCVSFYK